MKSTLNWLIVPACAWFGIGGAYFLYRGIPQTRWEWKTYSLLDSESKKRDVLIPGLFECTQLIRKNVPSGAELVLLSDVDEAQYGYLSIALDYELYPFRHLNRSAYSGGLKPKFLLVYMHLPQGVSCDEYSKIYESPRFALWEKKQP